MIRHHHIFLVACLLTFYTSGFGQKNPQNILPAGNFEPVWTLGRAQSAMSKSQSIIKLVDVSVQQPLRGNFYSANMGMICKKEWAFEKSTGLPLKFRLGSIDYTNYLEQKNGRRY